MAISISQNGGFRLLGQVASFAAPGGVFWPNDARDGRGVTDRLWSVEELITEAQSQGETA